VWIDTVRQGSLTREVGGPGTLVPEQIRWVVAREAARVEVIHAQAGVLVTADTILLELSNPDLELRALEASRELGSGQAELTELRASLQMEQLKQESEVARLETEQREAQRQAAAGEELAQQNIIAALELTRRREHAAELKGRVAFERRRAGMFQSSNQARIQAGLEKLERLSELTAYRAQQVSELRVRAGLDGVLQELSLAVGQQVAPGALLAKVAQLDKLKAQLRISEVQARDVRVGQTTAIDTRNALVQGHVVRIDPAVQQGSVTVDVAIDDPLPPGARPEQSVDGRIELAKLDGVLYVGRPAFGKPDSAVQLFVLDADGRYAQRRTVQLGTSSVSQVAVVAGLREGEQVILSEMSSWDSVDRIELEGSAGPLRPNPSIHAGQP
jgi:multidrug efflux pump subunit AcrA (membrane-fusion protein)